VAYYYTAAYSWAAFGGNGRKRAVGYAERAEIEVKKIDGVTIIALAAVASAAYPKQAMGVAEAVGAVVGTLLLALATVFGFLFSVRKALKTKPVPTLAYFIAIESFRDRLVTWARHASSTPPRPRTDASVRLSTICR
jgi:hypothetical protein